MSGQRPGQSDIYWRRRVFALTAAIGVLALIAWTLNGALGGAGKAQQAADTTHTGQHHHHALAAPASPAPSTGAATPTPTATATPHPTGQAKAKDGQRSTGKHGQQHAGQQAGLTGTAGTCPPGSVVLSLFAAKYRYLAHQTPRFQIDVVSTAARPCSFNVGAKHVLLVIKAGGIRRVWDSAACVQSSGSRMERLARGVPAVLRVSWDRKTAGANCQAPGPAARPGTYNAIARSGRMQSQSMIFILAGPGVAVP
jgi:hypothetical protein